MKKTGITMLAVSLAISVAALAGCGESTPETDALPTAQSSVPSTIEESVSAAEEPISPQPDSSALAVLPEEASSATSSCSAAAFSASSLEQKTTEKKLLEKEYKTKCASYDYKKLVRSPEKYVGKYAKFHGKVLQVMEVGNFISLRIGTKENDYGNYYDNIIYAVYLGSSGKEQILEDDMVTVYGKMGELYIYKNVMGSEFSVPRLDCEYVELDERERSF